MSIDEFKIIDKFFKKKSFARTDVKLGIGDDAAILKIPNEHELIVTCDTLIKGVHFPEITDAFDIGYKSLAVNLSDLAAMGATPTWIMLSLTLEKSDEAWLQNFSDGFFNLLNQYQLQLVGGDLTKGPLSITVQAMGLCPVNLALRRDAAKVGDLIYVTNYLGDASFELSELKFLNKKIVADNLNRPEPQIAIGEKLRGIAHACIDISDGLLGDLQHILENSDVGACIHLQNIPLSSQMKKINFDEALQFALNGGDDYELCFTVPKNKTQQLNHALKNYKFSCIGEITSSKKIKLKLANGSLVDALPKSFQHF